ncbi:rod shape-determining protein RodA [soil metagenome]
MKRKLLNIDVWLLLPVLVLVILGLLTLLSVDVSYFKSQLIFFIFSLGVFYFFSQIDYRMVKQLALPIYISSIVLLFIVLVIGIESRGSVRWIDVFGIRIQFSEIFKPFLTIAFASFLSVYEDRSVKSFLGALLLLAPVAGFIALQPDLGNALIYAGVAILTLLIFGYPFYLFATGAVGLIAISPLFWSRLHDYQKQRVLTFLNPTSDPTGTSYNVIQAIIAVGSGKFLGRGISEGTQSTLRFLPERHTDFIFATLSEGMGFVGALLVLFAFAFLCYRIYSIFERTEDTYQRLITVISFCFILIHFFVNMGMNVGLLPIVGVTLPFVSYGGSSLLSNFIFLGMLSSISVANKNKFVLEIH